MKVHERSPKVIEMGADWPMIDALMGGSRAMRGAGIAHLPRWPNEELENYSARLATATLYPAFRRTVRVMVGKPFSKQLIPGDDVPEPIKVLADNIDAQGSNLHTFCAEVSQEAMAYGLAGVLVDYSRTAGKVRTRADELRMGARPYWVWIRHSDILGWRSEKVNGIEKLTQLRLREAVEVDDGEFGTKWVEQVRVLTPGAWALYQKVDTPQLGRADFDEYVLVDQGPMAPLTEIPFVAFFGEKTGFMQGRSPLVELGHLNVKHWQSQSDQDTILHVARVPILAAIGMQPDQEFTVSASTAAKLPVGGDLKWVEHSGAAIGAGQTSLEALEQQMIQTGAELLIPKPGQRSATEANNDAEGNKSELQRFVERIEDGIDQCLQFTAKWMGLPEGGHCSLFKDFGSFHLSDTSAQLVLAMHGAGLISKPTAIREQQRRGNLSPDLDPDEELAAAEAEGPSLSDMTAPGTNRPPPANDDRKPDPEAA